MTCEISLRYANRVICLLGKSLSNGRAFASHTNNGELLCCNSQGLGSPLPTVKWTGCHLGVFMSLVGFLLGQRHFEYEN